MADEKKPDPVDDLKRGLGLLFRAARTAVDELPTGKLEDAVKTGVREVGRAIENVADTIDKQLFKKGDPADPASPHAPPVPPADREDEPAAAAPHPPPGDAPGDAPAPPAPGDRRDGDGT